MDECLLIYYSQHLGTTGRLIVAALSFACWCANFPSISANFLPLPASADDILDDIEARQAAWGASASSDITAKHLPAALQR